MKHTIAIVFFLFIYLPHSNSQPYSSLKSNSYNDLAISEIAINGDDIWMSALSGLMKYNKTTGETKYYNTTNSDVPDDWLFAVFCEANGNVWVGGRDYGIGKYTGEQWTTYNEANSGLPLDQHNLQIKTDKNGNVWIVSYCWMVKFDGVNWKNWKTGSSISSYSAITGFDIDENNVVWVYSTDGIGKIENDEYTIISDIGSDLITKAGCVKIDNEQNIWIAIENQGLYKYDGTEFINFSDSNSCLTTNSISDISFDPQDKMWLCSAGGLVEFNDSICTVYRAFGQHIFKIEATDNDTIWCGTLSGNLLCFDSNGFSTIDLSNPASSINSPDLLLNSFEEQNSLFQLFPNPVENELYIKFNDSGEKYIQANIYDLSGGLIIKFPGQLVEANSPHLQFKLNNQLKNSGVYVLSINSGPNVFNKKFIFKK